MGFAVVNIFGVESYTALWPLLLIYVGVAMAIAAQWALSRTRTVLFAVATLTGLAGGCLLGHLTTRQPEATASVADWDIAVAQAAGQVDLHKEHLARYIDENLPDIPEVLHANCREIEDVLASRGLLCVDVGPDTPKHAAVAPSNSRGYTLWVAYRSAKADLDRLIDRPPLRR